MSHDLFVAVISGLGGMLGWSFADFLAKKTIDVIGDLRTLIWSQALGIIPLLLIFALHPIVPVFNKFDSVYLFLFGLVDAVSYLLIYRAFSKGLLSVINPIFTSYSVVVVLFSTLVFHERLGYLQSVAIAIVFLGVLFLGFDAREIRSAKTKRLALSGGVPEIIMAVFVYAFWLLMLDRFLSNKPWVLFILIIRIITSICLAVYALLKSEKITITDSSLWKYIVWIGSLDVAAYGLVSYGFSASTHTSIIAIFLALIPLPTVILARIFLKEKLSRLQLAASLIIVFGAVALVIA